MPMVFAPNYASTAIPSNSTSDDPVTKADPGNPESRMGQAPKSRAPEELSVGFGQSQNFDTNDNAPAHSEPGELGEPVDERVKPTMPPERSRTSVLQGRPTHTSVQGPPLASSGPRANYENSGAESRAFSAALKANPRG
jgi:hypothetical protein